MKPSLLLRIASALTLLFAAGHTLGGISSWSPIGETEVLSAMRSFQFAAGGMTRTYLDFYLGFGFIISAYLFVQALALWQLASIAKSAPNQIRPLIGSLLLLSIASAFLSWRSVVSGNST